MAGTDYFTYTNLIANSLARASDVNARVAAIQTAFGMLPTPEKIQQGRATYAEDTDGANAIVVSLDFAPASYTAGLELTVKVATANTGATTINVNGLGAKAIKRADGTALVAGDLIVGQIVKLVYDGTNFRLIGGTVSSDAVGAAASASAAAASATAAATSATAAATSASAAATSATNAANSATSAANSAASAASAVSGYAALAGANFTGAVDFAAAITVIAPTSNFNPATKKYVDDAVFAAGSVSADETTIHSTAGVFGLKSIAANSVLGTIGAGVPGALSKTQLTTLVNSFSSTLSGAAPASGGGTTNFLRADGSWAAPPGTQTTITGNAGTATTLQTPRTIAISGAVTGTATSFNGSANITIPITALDVGAATTGTLAVARGGTGVTTSTGSGANVLGTAPTLSNPVVGTQTAGDNSTKAASTAFVQTAIAGKASAFLTVAAISTGKTLADSDNNTIIQLTSAATITANSTPTAGFSCILINIGASAWTFSCAGGVYIDGATSTATSASIPSGARVTAIHLGSGVWLLAGV